MTSQHQTYGASTDPGSKSAAELEREVRQSRAEVEDTLDAIQDRLSPGQMADQVAHYVRDNGGEFARNLGQVVKQNPVPMLLVGVGLAWMMLGSRRDPGLPRAADLFDDDDDLGYGPDYAAGRDPWRGYEPGGGAESDDDEGRASAAVRRAREGLSEASDRAKAGLSEAAGRVRAGVEQAADATHGARAGVGRLARGARARASGVAQRARRTGAQARHYGSRARAGWVDALQEHPLVLGTVGFAIGAAIAAALPPSRREDELLGDTSDDLRRRAWAAGREGYVQAKSAAAAAYAAAEHEAREQGLSGEGVELVAETVRHKVETVAQAATEAAKQKAGFGEQEPGPNQDASRYGQAGFQDRGDGEPT